MLNKDQIAEQVARSHGLTHKEARQIVDTVFETIALNLAHGATVRIHEFGTFESRATPARQGRNPQSGAPLEIPAGRKVVFSTAAALKRDLL